MPKKPITAVEQKRRRLHLIRTGLFAKMSRTMAELADAREAQRRSNDPEYARLADALEKLDVMRAELEQRKREIYFDSLSRERQKVLRSLGMDPHQEDLVTRRTTGTIKATSPSEPNK